MPARVADSPCREDSFDHNLPHKLRTNLGALGNHEIVTASYMGWEELKNGELLQTAEENGIEILVTGDRSLVYEQNLAPVGYSSLSQ